MADDRVRQHVDDDDLVRAPAPFNHIVASPVYSPLWGRGWLGYTVVGDAIDLWFVYGDLSGSTLLEYTEIQSFNDKSRSQLWMIFKSDAGWDSDYNYGEKCAHLVFLLNPPEDSVLFPVPAVVRYLMENEDGRRGKDRVRRNDGARSRRG
jgi:hypothetical protein